MHETQQQEEDEDKNNNNKSNKKKNKKRHKKEGKSRYRCFSCHPLDSLIRGCFFNHKEMSLYLKVCQDHSRQQQQRGSQQQQEPVKFVSKSEKKAYDDKQDLVMLKSIVKHYCQEVLLLFDKSQFVESAIKMLILHAFLASSGIDVIDHKNKKNKKTTTKTNEQEVLDGQIHLPEHQEVRVIPTFCQRQIRSLTTGISGRCHSLKMAVMSLIGCSNLLITSKIDKATTTSSTATLLSTATTSTTTSEEEIYYLYDSVLVGLVEIKNMLLSLYHDLPSLISSDGSSIMMIMINNMSKLFHKKYLSRPVFPTSRLLKLKIRGKSTTTASSSMILQEMSRNLKMLLPPLINIKGGLSMLSCSTTSDAILELLQMDTDAYHRYILINNNNKMLYIDMIFFYC